MSAVKSIARCCLLLFSLSCGGGGGAGGGSTPGSNLPPGPGTFTALPMDPVWLNHIIPLGWINPPGHTIPTDHIYFGYVQKLGGPPTNGPLTVYAPGTATIQQVNQVPVAGIAETKVWFRMTGTFTYYLDHVVLDASLHVGSSVTAGQRIGTTGLSPSFDMGVIDEQINLAFLNPARYGAPGYSQTYHCGKPLTYFTEALKSQLYPLVDREGADKDGRIDFDLPGRLIGNWFLDASPPAVDGSPAGWDRELAFAYDCQHPSKVLISIGGTLALMGKWGIPADAPDPATIGVTQGLVVYPLWAPFDPIRVGTMLVQLTDDSHLKVQVFPGNPGPGEALAFDGNARIYAR